MNMAERTFAYWKSATTTQSMLNAARSVDHLVKRSHNGPAWGTLIYHFSDGSQLTTTGRGKNYAVSVNGGPAEFIHGSLERKLETKVRAAAIAKLREWQGSDDIEQAHSVADDVLCNLLVGLGYSDVVEEWRKVGKWYA